MPPARAWVNAAGELYWAASPITAGDAVAPPRPSSDHQWDIGTGWVLDVAIVRAAAVVAINEKAEEVRLRYITPGAGQAGTYLIKERESEAFKAAGYTGDIPGMVQAEMTATGFTAQESADLILAQRDLWVAKAAQIEAVRRTGNVELEALTTQSAIELLQAATIASLDAL